MASTKNGILGNISGKVGTVTGGSWNGKSYIRANTPKRKNGRFTEEQLSQQAKFKLMSKFVRKLSRIFMVSFKHSTHEMSGINGGLSYNMQHAIAGTYPNFTVSYKDVLISSGQLLAVRGATAVAGAGGMIKYTWTDNSGVENASPTDICIIVVYCPLQNIALTTLAGTARSSESFDFDASYLSGESVETWIGFISANRKLIANSVYTGKVIVS